MQHFAHIDSSLISHLENDFRHILSDPDPGVMEASLLLFHDLIKVWGRGRGGLVVFYLLGFVLWVRQEVGVVWVELP